MRGQVFIDDHKLHKHGCLPIYRQVGNLDPIAAGDTLFLVCRVMRGVGLISLGSEVKDSVSASVSVEFMGLKKNSKVISNTTAPVWDDEVFFKVSREWLGQQKRSIIFDDWAPELKLARLSLNVWDSDENMTSPLGYTSVSMEDIYYNRSPTNIVSFASRGRLEERFVWKVMAPLRSPFAQVAPGTLSDSAGLCLGHTERTHNT